MGRRLVRVPPSREVRSNIATWWFMVIFMVVFVIAVVYAVLGESK